MRWGLPAALFAVLGLSCGSSSGEEVATDVVAFQCYSDFAVEQGVVVIRKAGEVVDYRTDLSPTAIPDLRARRVLLPFVESDDGAYWLFGAPGGAPYSKKSRQRLPPSVVRCFPGGLCQTSGGDVVDGDSLEQAVVRSHSEVRGASDCYGRYCIVGGRALLADGTKSTVVILEQVMPLA